MTKFGLTELENENSSKKPQILHMHDLSLKRYLTMAVL
jgi:hypothetical protein